MSNLTPIDLLDLHSFVVEHIHEVPVARRIVLLRTLAEVVGSSQLAHELSVEASALEKIEEQHQQMLLNFLRRSA